MQSSNNVDTSQIKICQSYQKKVRYTGPMTYMLSDSCHFTTITWMIQDAKLKTEGNNSRLPQMILNKSIQNKILQKCYCKPVIMTFSTSHGQIGKRVFLNEDPERECYSINSKVIKKTDACVNKWHFLMIITLFSRPLIKYRHLTWIM